MQRDQNIAPGARWTLRSLYDCFREGVLWTGESQIFVEFLYSLAVSVTVHIMTADGMV